MILLGLLLTDFGIFLGWERVLANLCPLWLGMSGVGYFLTGLAVRSRALLTASLFHLLGILILPYIAILNHLHNSCRGTAPTYLHE